MLWGFSTLLRKPLNIFDILRIYNKIIYNHVSYKKTMGIKLEVFPHHVLKKSNSCRLSIEGKENPNRDQSQISLCFVYICK